MLWRKCQQLTFSPDQIMSLQTIIPALELTDAETLKMSTLHSYLKYSNDACDDLMQKTSNFATEEEYGQYFDGSAQGSSAVEYESSLKNAIEITKSQLDDMTNIIISNGTDETSFNGTDGAFELAEVRRLKIAGKIITILASIKEVKLGIKPASEMAEIKDDFMENVVEAAEDLSDHVSDVLYWDDVLTRINENLVYIGQAQHGLSSSLAFSFLN